MIHTDPLPLMHSWPLFGAEARTELGRLMALWSGNDEAAAAPRHERADADGIGIWSCNLRDNSLRWSPAVYELFGIPTDEPLTRALTVSCYREVSRAAMESLRAHAIRHRRGFTMDAMLRRPDGETRWMRLSALPILCEGKAVRLCGTKQDVTAHYDGPGWRGFQGD